MSLSAAWMAVLTGYDVTQTHPSSWHFFDRAARLVFGHAPAAAGGGVAVYAVHPKFQFGPLTIVVAEAVRLVSFGHTSAVAMAVMGALAPLVLWLVLDARRAAGLGGDRLPVAMGLTLAMGLPVAWSVVSIYARHLDDALAITFAIVALWGVAKRSDLAIGLGLGLAVAAKPWAAAFLPLVLASPPGRRTRAGGVALAIAVVPWLPFVLGATGTTAALGHFTIHNAPDSALRALGVHDRWTPRWDRAAQVLAGGAAATWCVRTGRWPAVLMAAASVRLVLDPGTHRYYLAGLVVFTFAWELLTERWPAPLLSVAAGLALLVPHDLHWTDRVSGDIRLAACVAVLACAVAVRGPVATALRNGRTAHRVPATEQLEGAAT